MLGVVLAVFALILFGFAAISRGLDLMRAWHYAAVVALLVYIVYAQRRTTVLVKEETEETRQEADRALAPLNLSTTLASGLTLRWRARTYVGSLIMVIVLGASAAWAWSERSWLLLALCGMILAWTAGALLGRIREPEVLRIGPMGIEDTIGVGLIPWQDVKSVSLQQSEIKGTKTASLWIDVREAYLEGLSPVARFWLRLDTLGYRNAIRIQVHTLDMAPVALFRLIRAFHERTLPAGAISGKDEFYMVDLPFGEWKQVMAELDKTLVGPASASGGLTRRQEELAARLDAVVKAHQEQTSRTLAQADKVKRWPAIVAVLLVVLIMLLVGTVVLSR